MPEDPRLVRAWDEQTRLRKALSDLLEQIDLLNEREFDKLFIGDHVGWDAAVEAAREAL